MKNWCSSTQTLHTDRLSIADAVTNKLPLTHPMDPTEYARMDTSEDAMWWYRALHARLCDALGDVRGRVLDAG